MNVQNHGSFDTPTTFYRFKCNICGEALFAASDVIHGVHSCGGSFYKVTEDNVDKRQKIEINQKEYYLYECPIDGEKIYVRRAGSNITDYKKIEKTHHCEKIVTYEKGTQYSIQVKRTMNDKKSSTKTLSNVTLNTDNHSHTNACYVGHNHTANRCTPIYHKHTDDCYEKVPKPNYFDIELNSDGTTVRPWVNTTDYVEYRASSGSRTYPLWTSISDTDKHVVDGCPFKKIYTPKNLTSENPTKPFYWDTVVAVGEGFIWKHYAHTGKDANANGDYVHPKNTNTRNGLQI